MPFETLDCGTRRGTGEIWPDQHQIQRDDPRAAGGEQQRLYTSSSERLLQKVLRQPPVCESGLYRREGGLHTADGATKLRSQPTIVTRVLQSRIAHHHLYVTNQVLSRERMVKFKESMIMTGDGYECDIHEPLAQLPLRHPRSHNHIGSGI